MPDNPRKTSSREPVSRDQRAAIVEEVTLTIEYPQPNFRWQMVFNAFSLEKVSHGTLLRVAYVSSAAPGGQLTAPEIVPILLSTEGLVQLREAAKSYIADFGPVEPYPGAPLPTARQFSPLFSNHVRVSRRGDTAECAFYTVPIHDIALAAKGSLPSGHKVTCVQVALLHSDLLLHKQVMLSLLNTLPS